MNKTELLDKLARDGEERLVLARALDKLNTAQRKNIPAHTGFLSPAERSGVERLIAAAQYPRHLFWGGFPQAERTVCVFLPDWQEEEEFLALEEDSPLSALACTFPGGSGLTHRDFLGAILGQGITREKIGDLLVGEDRCDIIVLRELEDYLRLNLTSAGRVSLKVSPLPLGELQVPAQKVSLVRDTVAAPRLDAVAASAFSLSRGKAADLISAGRLLLNYRECTKPDRAVAEGDVLSCRGLGKCSVKRLGGRTKKGRLLLELERYR